jgi:hypothetical protein
MRGQLLLVVLAGSVFASGSPLPTSPSPVGRSHLTVRDQRLQIALPEFQDSIALRLRRLDR